MHFEISDKPSGTYACALCPDLEFKRARAHEIGPVRGAGA